jgi:Tfp pilus assembly protein PilX
MKNQQGATILVVLVLLVVMLMAGMALFRATDVAGLIAANTANKQKATQLANQAIVTVMDGFYAGTITPYSGSTALTYEKGIPDPNNSANSWTGAENSNNCTATGWTAISGNTGFCYRYIVEELWCMDSSGNVREKTVCGSGSTATTYSSLKTGSGTLTVTGAKLSTYYRVTINVSGPKNANSYVQSIYSW